MESLLTGSAYSENELKYVSDNEHHNACHKLRLQLLLIDHDATRDSSRGGEQLEAAVFGGLSVRLRDNWRCFLVLQYSKCF